MSTSIRALGNSLPHANVNRGMQSVPAGGASMMSSRAPAGAPRIESGRGSSRAPAGAPLMSSRAAEVLPLQTQVHYSITTVGYAGSSSGSTSVPVASPPAGHRVLMAARGGATSPVGRMVEHATPSSDKKPMQQESPSQMVKVPLLQFSECHEVNTEVDAPKAASVDGNQCTDMLERRRSAPANSMGKEARQVHVSTDADIKFITPRPHNALASPSKTRPMQGESPAANPGRMPRAQLQSSREEDASSGVGLVRRPSPPPAGLVADSRSSFDGSQAMNKLQRQSSERSLTRQLSVEDASSGVGLVRRRSPPPAGLAANSRSSFDSSHAINKLERQSSERSLSRQMSVQSLTSEQYEAYRELEQAELLAEMRRLEVTLEEERLEKNLLRETFAAELVAQQDAHERDMKMLKDIVAKLSEENKELSNTLWHLSVSGSIDLGDTSGDAKSLASVSTSASDRETLHSKQALLGVLKRHCSSPPTAGDGSVQFMARQTSGTDAQLKQSAPASPKHMFTCVD